MRTVDVEFINELEAKYPVSNWVICGFHVWPLLRIQITNRITKLLSVGDTGGYSNARAGKLKHAAIGQFSSFYYKIKDRDKNQNCYQPAELLFLSNQASKVLVNGYWYDRLCDPLIDQFKFDGLTSLHLDLSHYYKVPRHNPSFYAQPVIDLFKLRAYLSKKKFNLDALEGFYNMLDEVENNWNISFTDQYISRQIELINIYASWFEKIIKRAKHKIAFMVYYYDLEGMALNLACSRCGIPSIDIQHGVQGEGHRAYGNWQQLPSGGFELLPSMFWCWSDYEVQTIKKWNKGNSKFHQPFIGGNPWLDICQTDLIKDSYKSEIVNFRESIQGKKIKCLICLSGLKKFGVKLEKWLLEYMKNSPTDWIWMVRIHPLELSELPRIKKELLNYGNICFEIDLTTCLPLSEILSYADFHITAWSSTAIEAYEFGVPTIFTDEKGQQLFNEQLPPDFIYQACDYGSLAAAIRELLEKRLPIVYYQPRLQDTVQMLKKYIFD